MGIITGIFYFSRRLINLADWTPGLRKLNREFASKCVNKPVWVSGSRFLPGFCALMAAHRWYSCCPVLEVLELVWRSGWGDADKWQVWERAALAALGWLNDVVWKSFNFMVLISQLPALLHPVSAFQRWQQLFKSVDAGIIGQWTDWPQIMTSSSPEGQLFQVKNQLWFKGKSNEAL